MTFWGFTVSTQNIFVKAKLLALHFNMSDLHVTSTVFGFIKCISYSKVLLDAARVNYTRSALCTRFANRGCPLTFRILGKLFVSTRFR